MRHIEGPALEIDALFATGKPSAEERAATDAD